MTTRWILAICAFGVSACSSADFALGEPEETDSGLPSGDTSPGVDSFVAIDGGTSDAAPSEVAHDGGHDSRLEDAIVSGDAGSDTSVTTIDAVVPADAAFDTGRPEVGLCTGKPTCEDGNACTVDDCNPATGACRSVLIDKDGDGVAPKSLGACGLDCNDSNADAHPGQPAFFTSPHAGASGLASFDYNCDGVEELEKKTLGYCYYDDAGFCVFSAGFITTAPKCGESKQYVTACNLVGEGCYPAGAVVTQGCR